MEDRLEKLEKEIYENLKPWDRVQIARLPERPTTLDYIMYLFTDFIEFHGDRAFGDDQAIVGGIAKYKGKPVTVSDISGEKIRRKNPSEFWNATSRRIPQSFRLMKQAEKFQRPVIAFIDTKGAYPGKSGGRTRTERSHCKKSF